MPSTNKTPRLGLNCWEIEDKPFMEDFNEDNEKLDAFASAIHESLDDKVDQEEHDETVAALTQALAAKVEQSAYIAFTLETAQALSGKVDRADYDQAVDALEQALEGKVEKSAFDQAVAELEQSLADRGEDIRSNANDILQIYSRLGRLEDMLINNVRGNPFSALFANLSGLEVNGVWNQGQQKIEF